MTVITNRERFKNNIERRVNGVINALRLLHNCSNITNYKYTDKEAQQICKAVSEATEHCLSSFDTGKFKVGFKLRFDLILDEPDQEVEPTIAVTPEIPKSASPVHCSTMKRKFTVRFENGKEKSTFSPHVITCAVVAPHGDTYRVCDWFKTVREAHQYISEHPAIVKAIVTPAIPSKTY